MSDLLAKCDWNNDELRVELPQWPEVVSVWVSGKAMPYVPVVNDSKCDTCEAMLDCDECQRADASHKELRGLQAENEKLRERVAELEELTDGKLYIPQEWYQLVTAENAKLRELVRDMARAWWACDNERCPHGSSCDAAVSEGKLTECEMERRIADLGCEVDE